MLSLRPCNCTIRGMIIMITFYPLQPVSGHVKVRSTFESLPRGAECTGTACCCTDGLWFEPLMISFCFVLSGTIRAMVLCAALWEFDCGSVLVHNAKEGQKHCHLQTLFQDWLCMALDCSIFPMARLSI